MTNPCPAHIGCPGDCNECNYKEKVMDKCKDEKCNSHSTLNNNHCERFMNISDCKDTAIAALQAELKLYKRAVEMACEDLKSSLEFNYGYAEEG